MRIGDSRVLVHVRLSLRAVTSCGDLLCRISCSTSAALRCSHSKSPLFSRAARPALTSVSSSAAIR